jgi:LysR family transcriptional regulator for metE and metH
MGNIEIKHLRMICAIVESGTMTKAANKLFVTQSALSQQLKDLEQKLGVELFVRTSRKMVLSSIGKMILKRIHRILEELEETEFEISRIVSGEIGELKVGTQCTFCFKWLPSVMKAFQDKYPGVEVEVGQCTNIADDLESKRYDFIITAKPHNNDRFVNLPLFEDQVVCILPHDHPLSIQPYIHLKDFGSFNLISHTDKENNGFYQSVLKPREIHPKRFLNMSQPQAMIEMVAAGFGIAPFPRWAVRSLLEKHGLIERKLTKDGFPLTWQATFLPRRNIPLFQKEFIKLVGRHNIPLMVPATCCQRPNVERTF